MDSGALAEDTLNVDESATVLNCAIHRSEAQPRTLFFGRKERLHCALEYFQSHASSRVADGQPDEVARPRIGNARSGISINGDVASFYRDHAAVGHGVPRIDCEIENRIVDIAGIGQGLTRVD